MKQIITVDQQSLTASTNPAYLFFVCLAAAMGGVTFGYDGTVFGASQLFVRRHFTLSDTHFGLVIAAAALGCILAPLLGGSLCDRFGSKRVMAVSAAVMLTGALGAAMAVATPMLFGFRILSGCGIGLISLACPMFIAEIASAEQRGRLGFLFQLGVMIGSLLGVVFAWVIACHLPGDIAWRVIIATSGLVSLLFLLLSLRLPASPRWLVANGRVEEARAILLRLNGASAESILAGIQQALQETTASWRELLLPAVRPALIVGVLLAVFNNWTGWSAVSSYLPTLYHQAGYLETQAVGMTIIPTAVGLLFTFAAVALIDHAGRRLLWIGTSAAMVVALSLLGVVLHLHLGGPVIVGATLLVALPHMVGLGPLPWLMMSEIFPNHLRARAVSLCTTMLWLASFTAVGFFPRAMAISTRLIGSPAGVCWLLAGICILAFFFGLRLLPETRGRSLEEIAAAWKG